MSSPRKDLRSQASRSRFHEGSMNDRVSAVPPVQFLGPEEREVLERPLEGEYWQHRLYQLPRAQTQTQLHIHMQPLTQVRTQAQPLQPHHHHQKSGSTTSKKGVNLFGQVWEGVREKLKLRRDVNNVPDDSSKKKAVAETKKPDTERPSREETLANYHHLMASGFFSQHAIQSTRHARPKSSQRPSSKGSVASRGSFALSHRLPKQPDYPPPTPPIPAQWSFSVGRRPAAPLEPLTPVTSKIPAPFMTPASTSSRGTKRAAADEDDMRVHRDADSDTDMDDGDVPERTSTPHKLRRIASRTFVPMPQLLDSRPKLFTSRRVSSSGSVRGLPPVIVQQKEPPKKLIKRPQPPTASTSTMSSSGRSSLEFLTERMYTTVRRNVSENYYSVRAVGAGSMTSRILKPRGSAHSLSVKADASSRDVPRVPQLPSKYTTGGFGDDRENRQLWRAIVG